MSGQGIEERIRKIDGRRMYYARIRIGRRSRGKTFHRKTDAAMWLEQTKTDLRRGNLAPNRDANTIMAKVFERFIDDYAVSHYNRCEYLKTQTYLARWKKEIGHIPINEIIPSDIARVRDKMLKEEVSAGKLRQPATVRRYIQVLSYVFRIAIDDWGYIQHNPVARVNKPRPSRGRMRFLNEEEIRRMMEACRRSECPHIFPLVVLAISTGARRGEMMNLRWGDIYWEHSVIRLEKTKNGHPRSIPLAGLAKALLQRMHTQRRADTEYVFSRKDGQVRKASGK
jgi:integrase